MTAPSRQDESCFWIEILTSIHCYAGLEVDRALERLRRVVLEYAVGPTHRAALPWTRLRRWTARHAGTQGRRRNAGLLLVPDEAVFHLCAVSMVDGDGRRPSGAGAPRRRHHAARQPVRPGSGDPSVAAATTRAVAEFLRGRPAWSGHRSPAPWSPTNRLVVMLAVQSNVKAGDDVLGREVVIVEAVRTPMGAGTRKGPIQGCPPCDPAARRPIPRSSTAPASKARGWTTCSRGASSSTASSRSNRAECMAPGRPAVRDARTTIDRECGSAQQGSNFGATLIASGVHDVTIGSGVESMGRIPMFVGRKFEDASARRSRRVLGHYELITRGSGAEMIASSGACARAARQIGARSQQRAASAPPRRGARPRDVPVGGQRWRGEHRSGHPPGTTAAGLAELKPAFKEDCEITAGNSSQISDGAAAVLLRRAGAPTSSG